MIERNSLLSLLMAVNYFQIFPIVSLKYLFRNSLRSSVHLFLKKKNCKQIYLCPTNNGWIHVLKEQNKSLICMQTYLQVSPKNHLQQWACSVHCGQKSMNYNYEIKLQLTTYFFVAIVFWQGNYLEIKVLYRSQKKIIQSSH